MNSATLPLSLDDAIDQLLAFDHHDPTVMREKLVEWHGDEWLRAVAADHAYEIADSRIRYKLSLRRRVAEARAFGHTGAAERAQEMCSAHVVKWVDGKGRLLVEDLTLEDLRAIVAHYRTLAQQNFAKADLYEGFADLMVRTGAATLGETGADLTLLAEAA